MKRFYKFASLGGGPGRYSILLDGKPVKTPARHLLETEHQPLANAIMQEWLAQGDKIVLGEMHLTQLLNTKIDQVGEQRAAMTEAVLKYLDTDLLCYRAEHPPEVAKLQAESWDPWLDWFKDEFGCALLTTTSLAALRQPPEAHKSVREAVEGVDDDHFTILQVIVPACGSLVLGLAFIEGKITPQEVFDAARVEERYKAGLYNEQKYGADPAQEKKDKAVLADLEAAARYLSLLS